MGAERDTVEPAGTIWAGGCSGAGGGEPGAPPRQRAPPVGEEGLRRGGPLEAPRGRRCPRWRPQLRTGGARPPRLRSLLQPARRVDSTGRLPPRPTARPAGKCLSAAGWIPRACRAARGHCARPEGRGPWRTRVGSRSPRPPRHQRLQRLPSWVARKRGWPNRSPVRSEWEGVPVSRSPLTALPPFPPLPGNPASWYTHSLLPPSTPPAAVLHPDARTPGPAGWEWKSGPGGLM